VTGSSTDTTPDILSRIVETKRREVEALRDRGTDLVRLSAAAPSPRDFEGALRGDGRAVSLIAEVKRRSPGAGAIDPELDPVKQAQAYEAGGARALSVLTDREYFQGSLDDLTGVRGKVELPVLRKDFIIDERQIWEARSGGADAILLIVRILDDSQLREYRLLTEELGMSALIEVHDGAELERAVSCGARILGVNNRDLRSFRTDLQVTMDLLADVPDEVVLVSESGISRRDQVEALGSRGVDAILVGEALVRAGDPAQGAALLSGVPRSPRVPGEHSGESSRS